MLEPFRTGTKLPLTVLAVHVQKAYLHCAKALLRSNLWHEDARLDRATLPTASEILRDHVRSDAAEPLESQAAMEQRYKDTLY